MKFDIEPIDVDSNYIELVSLPINMVGVNEQEVDTRKLQDNTSLDFSESTKKPIYPKLGEELLDFLFKQKHENANVVMCPRCNTIFNSNVAIIIRVK